MGKGTFAFFYVFVCLSSLTECLVRWSVDRPAWRQHPLPDATYGPGTKFKAGLVRWTELLLLLVMGRDSSVCALPRRHFSFPSSFPLPIPHLSPLDFSSGPSESIPCREAVSIWGRRVPGLRALAHLCAEPRSRAAGARRALTSSGGASLPTDG